MSSPPTDPRTPAPPPGAAPGADAPGSPTGRRRSWLPFFLVLIVLGGIAVVVPMVYNIRQQLRPEQVEAAKAKWQARGPRDYVLEYQLRVDDEAQPYEYRVEVREGRPVSAICDGRPLLLGPAAGLLLGLGMRAVPMASDPYHTVDGLFAVMERLLREGQGERRNYITAQFDSRDGHPHRFIYRVAGTRQRLEWILKLIPLDPQTGKPQRER